MENNNEKILLVELKKKASMEIKTDFIERVRKSKLSPNQCFFLYFHYVGDITGIYELYNSLDKKRYVDEINELFDKGFIDVKLKKNDIGDIVGLMDKATELVEFLIGTSFNKQLLELGEELKNAYPRANFTLTKITNMDSFCRKYALNLTKSSKKFKMTELELHKKIIEVVKKNQINLKIVDFVESSEWEAYIDKVNKQNNSKIG